MAKKKKLDKANGDLKKADVRSVNLTNKVGKEFSFDYDKASDNIKILYNRALELKKMTIELETEIVEKNILINEYIDRILEEMKNEQEDKDTK